MIYSKNDNKDEILFPILVNPSVKNMKDTCNFAIHPSFVDNYLFIEKRLKVKVLSSSNGEFKYTFTDIGITNDDINSKWYNLEFEKNDAKYQIESLSCACGKKINVNDIGSIELIRNNEAISKDVLLNEALEKFDYSEMFDLKEIFDTKRFGSWNSKGHNL